MRRTVLLFGDSNTHGTCPMAGLGDVLRFDEATRWPGVLAARLGPAWRVIDEGQPGRTTVHDDPLEGPHKNGLRVLPALLESHRPLDLVVIKLGTNDLKARFAVTAQDIALAVEKLVLAVRGAGAGPGLAAPAVAVIAPPPILEAGCLAEMFAGGAAKSRALGARLAEVATRQGVAFLDAGAVIAVDPLDGIHYAAAAHAALGQAVADLIARHWP
jgi:lysophospholipase L1-like esterase